LRIPRMLSASLGRLVGVALMLASSVVAAQTFPNKPIRVIVPYTPGASIDTRVRMIVNGLAQRLGQQVIIDNKPGAGSTLGTAFVAKSAPDGYTLLFNNNSFAINQHVYKNPGYDALKDFVPIVQGYYSAMILVVHPQVKANSVKEFIALAKAQPEAMNYGSSGVGSVPQLAMEMLTQLAGVEIMHIPFKGDAQVLTDVLGGRVSAIFSGLPAAMPHVRGGKLRALAVSTKQRNSAFPDVPTVAESGYPSYELQAWAGFFAPAATPKEIVERLNREIAANLASPAVRAQLEASGAQGAGGESAQYAVFIRKEVERYGRVVKQIGLSVE
jgi:tripartite-type tricarboxylate transporter receptor subunit TctC